MRALIIFVLMLVSVSLQSTVIPILSVGGVGPDLVLVVVVSAALAGGRQTGFLSGVFGGLLQDLLSVGPFGFNTLSKMLVGFLVGLYERKVNKTSLLLPLLAVGAGTVGSVLVATLFFLANNQGRLISALYLQLIPVAAYHMLLTIPVHYITSRLIRPQIKK